MQDYQQAFIRLALKYKVLQFGQFTLKSGRLSPYFFNAGLFNDGQAVAELGEFYARAIKDSGVSFDILYGPAYKGIPLATAAAIGLYQKQGVNIPYCFNRKEVKDHGEGGLLVGAELKGRALIVDDVITAGTAIRESMAVLQSVKAELAGVVIALDRQEISPEGECSAVQEVENCYKAPVISIITLDDVISYVESSKSGDELDYLKPMLEYRAKYGI